MREVNERLCIEEVGVDLELCVHAHGRDVDLLIVASFKFNYSLGISHLIYGIWTFAIMVLTMFSFKYHFSCKFKHLSSAEQYPRPTSTLVCRRVLLTWYLENAKELLNFL